MSGTTLRKALAVADQNIFKSIFGWYDPKIFSMIKNKLSEQILNYWKNYIYLKYCFYKS